ncbi:MAG: IS66 family transposase [Anaerolineales bacterium]|nr:IS66 family transposase [Anaerolineales bacterium]
MSLRDEILAAYQAGPEATIAFVEAVVTALQQELSSLSAQVAQLQARLNKDSHNSHQPPSSNGPAKRPHPRSLRKRSGKKRGGQAGHPGVTRCLVDNPTATVQHVPAVCAECGADLETAPELSRERRQVFDIPEPRLDVTEHQAVHKACPACQTVTSGRFPPEVSQPVQFGARAQATMVYLQTYQLLPFERTVECLGDLFGLYPSEGTLASAQARAYTRLAGVEQAIGAALQQADVVHVDETGQRVAGRTAWVHVVSTALLTFYAHHAKRGREAIDAIGLLVGCAGRRVHDAWAPYLSLPRAYALCNAHLLRELIGLDEESGQAWIQKLIRLLLSMKATVEAARAAGQAELPAKQRAGFEAAYTRFLNEGLLANPPPKPTGKRGRPRQTPARNLLDRLVTHRAAILAFLYDFRVPFDNNQAERDLRMLKVKHKASGGFRSPEAAAYFCRIRGYISTLRKQGYSVLDGLTSVFTGQPVTPRLQA